MIAIFQQLIVQLIIFQKDRDDEAGIVGFDRYEVRKFSTSAKHVFL